MIAISHHNSGELERPFMSAISPTEFADQLEKLVRAGIAEEEVNAFVDASLRVASTGDAEAYVQTANKVLTEARRTSELAHALATSVGIFCEYGDIARITRYLERLVDITEEHKTNVEAARAAELVGTQLPGNVHADHVQHVLHQVIRLHLSADAFGDAIQTMLVSASLFTDFRAFQTAYRTLVEAERLAREHHLAKELTEVLMALHSTCMIEGDLAYADRVWEGLSEAFEKRGQPIPTPLILNRATRRFWDDQFESARQTFEEVIARDDLPETMRAGVLSTLSACLRELGDRTSSDQRMTQARVFMEKIPKMDPEHGLELELIAAKNAVTWGDFPEACDCLRRAISRLDDTVDLVEKLHYRRGLRERFIPRIENILVRLPRTGNASDVLAVIAGTRSNRLSDWLHFLAWTRRLKSKLTGSEAGELDKLVLTVANHGAPHLMGFREKYDDPLAENMLPDPWRKVAEYADRMCELHDVDRPFERATAAEAELLIQDRLDEGYAVLVNLLTADKKALLIVGDRYMLCDLPESETAAFAVALYSQRQSPGQSKPLAIAANAYQAALLTSLKDALDEVAAQNCRGLLFVPDRMDLTPINLVLLCHEPTRKRMAAGLFSVSTCLALYPAHDTYVSPKVALGILEEESGLTYDQADLKAFFEGSGTYATILNKPTWDEFSSQMEKSDTLVLAHHGMSIGVFTDPAFADMGGPHQDTVMSVSRLQEVAYRWPHRVAVLGTCHSGGSVNHNFQGKFKSHDLMGFPSLFLLNGKAEVVASSWAIMDRFNLVFTALFAPALRDMRPAAAASHALASLIEMSDDEFTAYLSSAFPEDHRLLQAAKQLNVLRRQPYCYGAYQTYTLL